VALPKAARKGPVLPQNQVLFSAAVFTRNNPKKKGNWEGKKPTPKPLLLFLLFLKAKQGRFGQFWAEKQRAAAGGRG